MVEATLADNAFTALNAGGGHIGPIPAGAGEPGIPDDAPLWSGAYPRGCGGTLRVEPAAA